MSNPQTPQPKQNSPVHRIRSGAISASIWEKIGTDPESTPWYSVDVQRCYKCKDDKFNYTGNFGRDEALTAAELLKTAWRWIIHRESKNAQESRQGSAADSE